MSNNQKQQAAAFRQYAIALYPDKTPEEAIATLMGAVATGQQLPVPPQTQPQTQAPVQAPQAPIQEPQQVPTQAPTQQTAPVMEHVDADYCEVTPQESCGITITYASASADKNNNTGGINMTTNITVKDARKAEVERDLAAAGLDWTGFIDLESRCRAAGLLSPQDKAEICRRADWYRYCDRQQQLAIDQAARRAEAEARAAARKNNNTGLTFGQKVWIGVGIAAVVLIIGGAVWWLISKKKADAAFSDEFDSSTESRCENIFRSRGIAI